MTGIGQRGQTTQLSVRPGRVVIDPPGLDDRPGIARCVEQILVQALVSEAAIKALHEGVLRRLAGRDVMPFDLCLLRLRPLENSLSFLEEG